ncbi:hypothetical protein ACFSQT_23375 [Mesorhizobium calcicola]|uniref:Glycosyltransferase RgtA/B/C/D-like domain-containing protein n=1 Tax=Mesorhizobium calcicola TaxID=1300310 RepID=A0ABW4WK58_9HYPH
MTAAITAHVPAVSEPAFRRIRARDVAMALLLGLLSFLVYNANLRSITAADSYAARYLPFSIWQNHSLTLNPILTTVAQGRKPPATPENDGTAHWILKVGGDRYVSKFPIAVPVILSPFYLPAVIYLNHHGSDPLLFDKVARIMEKLCASSLAAVSVGLLYLLLRRRTDEGLAAILSLLYAFGTTTWVISSQALWMHGLAQLLIVATMLLLTGPSTALRVVLAGLLCGLIAANRQPDAILAAGLGIYGLWWSGRMRPLLVLSGMLPVALTLAYNLMIVGNVAGAYALHVRPGDFNHDIVGGIAGLLVSPTRGLFVFSPFLLFVPIFCRRVAAERSERGLTVAVGCAMIVQVAFYAMIDWRQGISWGPRWLTDMLPMLMWMLPPVVKTLSRNGRVAFGFASLLAISIQAIGAFWYTGAADIAIVSTHGPGRMRPAWDIQNAAFIAELSHPHVQADLIVDLRGNIDAVNVLPIAQGAGDEAGRQIEILGWALTNNHSPSDVAVLVDGQWGAATRELFARADVEKALGQASPAGWRVAIPIGQLTPGEHLLAVLVRATEGGEPRLLKQISFSLAPDNEALEHVTDLPSAARRARQMLASHQQAAGYWLTSYTSATRFEQPRQELNTYLNAIMLDVVSPVAEAAGASDMLAKARQFLAAQIEPSGLVRYHGRPDAPTIGTLGCAITPDSDDTALAWRVAPSEKKELLQPALATITQFRRPDGLYQTWLAPRDKYQCLDPGRDPNPADVGIQMHLLLFLEQADKAAARSLCEALSKKAGDDDIWVYYAGAPLMITLRLADLEKAGCSPRFPQARLRTEIPGQEIWLRVADQLRQVESQAGSYAAYQRTTELLTDIAAHDFSLMSDTPPLLYHNDLTATVKRFYWSQDFGYALWLRLYFENERMLSKLPCGSGGPDQKCGEK